MPRGNCEVHAEHTEHGIFVGIGNSQMLATTYFPHGTPTHVICWWAFTKSRPV